MVLGGSVARESQNELECGAGRELFPYVFDIRVAVGTNNLVRHLMCLSCCCGNVAEKIRHFPSR